MCPILTPCLGLRRVSLFLFFSALALYSHAQDRDMKAYIGASIGPSFPDDNLKGLGSGLNLGFINFGYALKDGIGVHLNFGGGGHGIGVHLNFGGGGHRTNIEYNINNGPNYYEPYYIRYGTIMAGPMYTLHLSGKFDMDFKLKGGVFYNKAATKSSNAGFQATATKWSLGYGFGLAARYHLARHWSLTIQADYANGESSTGLISPERVGFFNTNAGILFRF